jgi:hypothetical protein
MIALIVVKSPELKKCVFFVGGKATIGALGNHLKKLFFERGLVTKSRISF